MKKIISSSQLKLLLLLLILVSSFCYKNLFLESKSVNRKEKSINFTTKLDIDPKQIKNKKRINLEKIYGEKIVSKRSPFNNKKVKAAKFIYKSKREEESSPLYLKDIITSFKLKGVINQAIAIINYKGKNKLVRKGTKIEGYQIVNISNDSVVFLKKKEKYFAKIEK